MTDIHILTEHTANRLLKGNKNFGTEVTQPASEGLVMSPEMGIVFVEEYHSTVNGFKIYKGRRRLRTDTGWQDFGESYITEINRADLHFRSMYKATVIGVYDNKPLWGAGCCRGTDYISSESSSRSRINICPFEGIYVPTTLYALIDYSSGEACPCANVPFTVPITYQGPFLGGGLYPPTWCSYGGVWWTSDVIPLVECGENFSVQPALFMENDCSLLLTLWATGNRASNGTSCTYFPACIAYTHFWDSVDPFVMTNGQGVSMNCLDCNFSANTELYVSILTE